MRQKKAPAKRSVFIKHLAELLSPPDMLVARIYREENKSEKSFSKSNI